jgi:hypothetical protein
VGGDHRSPDGVLALVTCTDVCQAADVEELPLERAWRTAQAERPWEPPEGWAELLRRRRRDLVLYGVVLAAAAIALAVIGYGVVRGSWGRAAAWSALLLLQAGGVTKPLWSRSARAAWEDDVRRRARRDHALRHHRSVGADHREDVTERAEEILSFGGAGLVGWPLGAVVAAVVVVAADEPVLRIAAALAAVLAVVALVRSRRLIRQARRWLADPLPRS